MELILILLGLAIGQLLATFNISFLRLWYKPPFKETKAEKRAGYSSCLRSYCEAQKAFTAIISQQNSVTAFTRLPLATAIPVCEQTVHIREYRELFPGHGVFLIGDAGPGTGGRRSFQLFINANTPMGWRYMRLSRTSFTIRKLLYLINP